METTITGYLRYIFKVKFLRSLNRNPEGGSDFQVTSRACSSGGARKRTSERDTSVC